MNLRTQELPCHLQGLPLVPERLRVLRPDVHRVRDRPLAMVRRVEGVRVHPEHPWVLPVPVSVRPARWGRGLHRQVLVRQLAILGLRVRGQILLEQERFLVRVQMGGRGSVLARREQGRPGWAATRVLEQVRNSAQDSVQDSERVLREQGHLVLAVSREPVREQGHVPELERSD